MMAAESKRGVVHSVKYIKGLNSNFSMFITLIVLCEDVSNEFLKFPLFMRPLSTLFDPSLQSKYKHKVKIVIYHLHNYA